MKALVLLDEDGHLHAFDAEDPKVLLGLALEAFKQGVLEIEAFVEVARLVGSRQWKEAIDLLAETAINLGRSGGNRFDVLEVRSDWVTGIAQFNS